MQDRQTMAIINYSKIVGYGLGPLGSSQQYTPQYRYKSKPQQQCREIEGESTVTREAIRLFRLGLVRLFALPAAAKQAWLICIRNARLRFVELLMWQRHNSRSPLNAEEWHYGYNKGRMKSEGAISNMDSIA
jgi:hypothetical protein